MSTITRSEVEIKRKTTKEGQHLLVLPQKVGAWEEERMCKLCR